MSDIELLAEPEPVRRLEVFTGAGRRRSWPAERKARIVGESYESGETVCAVARRHGLTPQQLFGWRRDARSQSENGAGRGGMAFTPVTVEAAPCADVPISPARPGGSLREPPSGVNRGAAPNFGQKIKWSKPCGQKTAFREGRGDAVWASREQSVAVRCKALIQKGSATITDGRRRAEYPRSRRADSASIEL
jgi:transposase